MAAHVPEYHSVWLQSEEKSHCVVVHDLPVGPSPKNRSGMQRGSAQVTADRLAGDSSLEVIG